MKTLLAAIACTSALALPAVAIAQSGSAVATDAPGAVDNAALARLRASIRADRKALVAKNLPLTEAEAKAFWPVYEKCRESLEAAQRKGNRVMLEYISAEGSITDAHARQLVGESLDAESEGVQARKNCYGRVAKVLPGRKAARYFQIEAKMAALSRFDAAVALPLVD